MLRMYVKELPPTYGGNVILSKSSWDELIEYLETVTKVVNRQAKVIEKLLNNVGNNTKDIKTIAEALGGIYNVET